MKNPNLINGLTQMERGGGVLVLSQGAAGCYFLTELSEFSKWTEFVGIWG
jgi:hypothetical protein